MSFLNNTIIRVTGENNFSYSGPIAEFIDNILDKNKEKIINIGNDSVVMNLEDNYSIIGVSNEEKTSWKHISQISRHPANGGMVKVYTRSGKTTTATLTHSFLKRTEKGIESIKGSDLKVGLRIPVAKYISEVENPMKFYNISEYGDVVLDNDFGWLCGVYIADGNTESNNIKITKCIPEYYNNLIKIVKSKFDKDIKQRFTERSNFKNYPDRKYKGVENNFNCKDLALFFGNNFGKGSENKKIPAWVYGANKEFISGVVQGYFDGDGNVNCTKNKAMIRCGSISETLINDMIVLLAYFGIFGSKCLEWSKTGKVKKPFHTIQISKKYARLFKDNIGFIVEEKLNNLDELVAFIEGDNRCDTKEYIDKLPEVSKLAYDVAKSLNVKYNRKVDELSIGRETLKGYIQTFEECLANKDKKPIEAIDKIKLLKQAAYSDIVWDEIIELEYIDDPKEYVYDFTVPGNDSFMVDTCILVHNTLNSVEWNTEILLDNNGKLNKVKIGEFIDNMCNNLHIDKIENHPNDTTLGWINDKNYKILSCTEDGQIEWKLIEAVTKHPPINEDGSNILLRVTTKSGREVIATKAKSFLKRQNNKIVAVRGDEIKIGDYLPVSNTLNISDENSEYFKLDNNFEYYVDLYLSDIELPIELLLAPFEFTKGFLHGLVENKSITSSNLNNILYIQQLLTKYHIYSSIITDNSLYKLSLNTLNVTKLKELFDIEILYEDSSSESDIIPDIVTKQFGTINIARALIPDKISKCLYQEDIDVLEKVKLENIIYDEVIDITEVVSDHSYVYDFTVKDTRNFNIYNGLCIRDTFHLSGVSSASKAVRGVPRIKELLSVTKNIKSPGLTIYVKDEFNQNKKKCKEILNSIETTYFKDIILSAKIYYDPDDFKTTIEEDRLFLATYEEFAKNEMLKIGDASPWLLRIEFDKEKMIEFDLTMIDLYHVLQDFYDANIQIMFNDDNAKKMIFRIKIFEDDTEDKDIITELKALEKNIMENIIIKGIKKINKVSMNKKEYMKYIPDTMTFEKSFEWILESSGSNLIDIFCYKSVDYTRTISNNINEIYETLGIEAARQALYNEIWEVIKDADLYVNYRHLSLLVDTMTNKGFILPIDRHGINRVDIGPLAKSSFEETTDMLIKAGIFSEVDRINGISANIMLGQIPPCGTGDTDILIDELKLLELINQMKENISEEEEQEEEEDTELEKDKICTMDNLSFDFTIPEIDKSIKEKEISIKVV